MGTDTAGRDVFTRLLYAGRVSLVVGLVAVAIYTAIGVVLGVLAGYYGGWVDSMIMRLADVVLSFPTLIIIITLASVLGPSIYNVMLAIGLLGWPPIARLLRGQLLSLREREFIIGARAVGCSDARLIFRHLLPNAMAPVLVAATFGIAYAILIEAGLSFLGLGVQPPTPSWGNMLTDAQSLTVLESMPWLWLPPGLMIALAVLSHQLHRRRAARRPRPLPDEPLTTASLSPFRSNAPRYRSAVLKVVGDALCPPVPRMHARCIETCAFEPRAQSVSPSRRCRPPPSPGRRRKRVGLGAYSEPNISPLRSGRAAARSGGTSRRRRPRTNGGSRRDCHLRSRPDPGSRRNSRAMCRSEL